MIFWFKGIRLIKDPTSNHQALGSECQSPSSLSGRELFSGLSEDALAVILQRNVIYGSAFQIATLLAIQ